MLKVDFYILSSNREKQRLRFVCKLAEKIYRQQQRAYILATSDQQSLKLDDLLWSFRPKSFIPHQLFSGDEVSQDNAILVGVLPATSPWSSVIINLSPQLLIPLKQTQRLIEILDATASLKQTSRKHYQYYKKNGYALTTHNINSHT